MEKSEKNLNIITIILVICVVSLGIYKLFFDKNTVEEEKIDTETISVVTDRNDFYTVSSIINNYIVYLSSYDTNKILTVLDSKYKSDNAINESNLANFITKLDGIYAYQPRKMFVQRMSENVYKYYTFGYLRQDTINGLGAKENYYLIVLLDQSNMSYSIIPYNGEMFK